MTQRMLALILSAFILPACQDGGSGSALPPPPPATFPTESGTAGGIHSGSIRVRILDFRLGVPIPSTTVVLGTEGTVFGLTDDEGTVQFDGLTPGAAFTITAVRTGYRTHSIVQATAKLVTLEVLPLSWTSPTIAGGISGLSLGIQGVRGYVDSDLLHDPVDAMLTVPDTTTTSDGYYLISRAGKPGLIVATETEGIDNLAYAFLPPGTDGIMLIHSMQFPSPRTPSTWPSSGGFSVPAELGALSTLDGRVEIFTPGYGGVRTGRGTFNLLDGTYRVLWFQVPWIALYRPRITVEGSDGTGSAWASFSAPPAALPLLSIPAPPAPLAPAAGATAVGTSPSLTWNVGPAPNAFKVLLRWTDGGAQRSWEFTVYGAATSLVVPALPAGVSALGLKAGIAVSWTVEGQVVDSLDPDDATEGWIQRHRTGASRRNPRDFTP